MNRRTFMHATLYGLAAPTLLRRLAHAAPRSTKTLVVVFQRGAVDGLSLVVPHGDDRYYGLRPSIAIPRDALVDLDGQFALHPALATLKPFYEQQRLAVIHAVGSPSGTRSHFDAQDFMESGTPDIKSTDTGWLNRLLAAVPMHATNAFRALAITGATPRIFMGPEPVLAFDKLDELRLRDKKLATGATFEAMYAGAVRDALQGPTHEAFDVLHALDDKHVYAIAPDHGAVYPKDAFGRSMQEIAKLIKADLGVQVAFADIGGWDTHVNQGAQNGQLANRLRVFGDSLSAFVTDLGEKMNDVVVVTMSEFGRTVRENGSRGTDHGHGNVMLVMHGETRGGKVYGQWPGLDDAQLYEGRDLAVTTDFRDVLWRIARGHLGITSTSELFPGFVPTGAAANLAFI